MNPKLEKELSTLACRGDSYYQSPLFDALLDEMRQATTYEEYIELAKKRRQAGEDYGQNQHSGGVCRIC